MDRLPPSAAYEIVFGSDVIRDGVFWELDRVDGQKRETVLEVFRSDQDGSLTFAAHLVCEVPFSVIQNFIHRASAEAA